MFLDLCTKYTDLFCWKKKRAAFTVQMYGSANYKKFFLKTENIGIFQVLSYEI